jgi:hypothetical protein
MADLANSRQQLQQLQQAVSAGEAENARLRREVDRAGGCQISLATSQDDNQLTTQDEF